MSYIRFAARNFLTNGSFNVWQRGTSFTPQTKYSADRADL